MEYLRILERVRATTGSRGDDRFPAAATPTVAFRRGLGSPATILVFDARVAQGVLESPAYRQFPFLDRILSIAKPDRTHWIRRFCEIGLIMIDGPEHDRRRASMAAMLDRCVERLTRLPADRTARAIEAAIREPGAAADGIARAVVRLVFAESLAAVVGRDVELPHEQLFRIDFFNPFPTLSSLSRCNTAIDACCRPLAADGLDADTQAVVLSLLIMGVSPLHALITAGLNQGLAARRSGGPSAAPLALPSGFDSYTVVPTNFVMRECVAADTVAGEPLAPGDVVYLFLGSATGCPFSRQTAVPFGAGAHSCSGAKLTSVMLRVVRSGLAVVAPAAFDAVAVARAEQGKASAFLMYPPPVD